MKTSSVSSETTTASRGPADVDLRAIRIAATNVAGHVRATPCTYSSALSEETGAELWLKRDDLQRTGSFKERGAANALALLSSTERTRGVVAASAGNHALGLALHGSRMGVPVTLVMPRLAARVKIERCRALGAHVWLEGETFEAADRFARDLAARRGARYVHPFDDAAVIAGQGTFALEVLAQVPQADTIVVPVGGGGLLAGAATAVKSLRPGVNVIAVEPEHAPSFAVAWQRGGIVDVHVRSTLADGLAVARTGTLTFALARDRVDAVVTVSEDEIAYAMLRLFEVERARVEGAGAVALAALLARKIPGTTGRTIVASVCGGNVDETVFAQALERAARGALR